MKRMILAAVASSLLTLAVPAIASAHHRGHHRTHHLRSHTRHAKRARLIRFGSAAASSAPASPSAPVTPSSDTAGTVASFTNGVLTIKLNDNSTVSGKVSDQTELRCQSATPTNDGDDDQGGGDDQSGSQSGEQGGPSVIGQMERQHGDFQSGEQGVSPDGDDNEQQGCAATALTPGATVLEAVLELSSAGAVWEQVDLSLIH